MYRFSLLEKDITALVRPGGWGGTRRKHRLGFPLAARTSQGLRRRRRGVSSPPALRRNQRLMIPSVPPQPPGHGTAWLLYPNFLQTANLLLVNNDRTV
jgi:poly-beta-hydroxyalkanoate depolymerase